MVNRDLLKCANVYENVVLEAKSYNSNELEISIWYGYLQNTTATAEEHKKKKARKSDKIKVGRCDSRLLWVLNSDAFHILG